MKNVPLWSHVVWLWAGSSPGQPGIAGEDDSARAEALSVTDTQGVSWPVHGMPRVAKLHLTWNP